MSPFDAVAAVALLAALAIGLAAGAVRLGLWALRLAIGLAALLAGALLGVRLADPVAGFLERWVSSPGLALALAFLAVLAAVLALGALAARPVTRALASVAPGRIDRAAGAGLAAAAVGTAALVAALAIGQLAPGSRAVRGSVLAPRLQAAGEWLHDRLPPRARARSQASAARARRAWERLFQARPGPAPPAPARPSHPAGRAGASRS